MSISAKTKQNILCIIVALVIVGAFYLFLYINSTMNKNTQYIYAKNGKITSYEEAKAIVLRDEEVLDTSHYSGDMQIVALDATKVAKGDKIVSFVVNKTLELQNDLNKLDDEIQELIENSSIEVSQDIKNSEKEIENDLYKLISNKNSIYDINILKKSLYSGLEKKIKQIGSTVAKDSELNKLISERNKIQNEINDSKTDLRSPRAGLVSYRIDGYEKAFSIKNFSSLSTKKIKNINLIINQQVPINSNKLKIIDNFYSYLVVITKSEEAKQLKLNDNIKISLDNTFTSYEKANVEYIIEDGDERILVFKIYGNSEKLSQYRVVKAYLVWWNYDGIKVQDGAIYDKEIKNPITEKVYAKVKAVKIIGNTGYQKEAWIKVEYSANGFSIISNYTDEELIELGIPQEMIDERNTLNMYDKVIIQ